MVSLMGIADALDRSVDMVNNTVGRVVVNERCDGSYMVALTASTTFYFPIYMAQCPMVLRRGQIRVYANGVAGGTIDIVKTSSGGSPASGIAMITQLTGNGFTANTNRSIAPLTASGVTNLNAGDTVFLKIVTGAAETLTPPHVSLIFD